MLFVSPVPLDVRAGESSRKMEKFNECFAFLRAADIFICVKRKKKREKLRKVNKS